MRMMLPSFIVRCSECFDTIFGDKILGQGTEEDRLRLKYHNQILRFQMKKLYLAISLIAVSIAYSSSIPANAQSFMHQLKDQVLNRHGGQYGLGGSYPMSQPYSGSYGSYPSSQYYSGSYGGNGYNSSGIYGNRHGWGQQQQLQQHQLQEHQQFEQQQIGY